jgi:ribonuclease HII
VALLAGVDEAGFGPTLGPLVVSGVMFRVQDDLTHRCLWEALRQTCCRITKRKTRRLIIADSKQLYHAGGTLAPLERAALVMLAVAGMRPKTWRGLVELLAPMAAAENLSRFAWYGHDVELPAFEGAGDVATRANAVRKNAREQNVEFLGAVSRPVVEDEYNTLLSRTDNKSVALQGVTLSVIDRIIRATDEKRVRICADRLGGLIHYREALQTAFPDYALQIIDESFERSCYRLESPARVVRIEFVTKGEEHHLPIALASVYSKYQRELYMRSFNAYWSSQDTSLRPTAGYHADARRWLHDAEPLLDRFGVDRAKFVRVR